MTQPGNALANIADEYGTGLEDIEDEISAVPRIGINHSAGTFKDSLSGEEFANIYGVLLGMVKQRVMWEKGDIEPGAKPQCKSQDAKTGYPNMGGKPGESFPWKDAPVLDPNLAPKDEHGRITLACETCPFAEWGPRNEKGKSTPPACKERYTFPVLYNREDPGSSLYSPPFMESGIVAFQGSGISPAKKFLSAFVRNKRPLYSAVTKISLDVNKRGMVVYSVPTFTKLTDVPDDDWELYARELGPLRDFLRRPPRPGDDQDDARKPGVSSARAAANVGTVVQSSAPTSQSPVTQMVNAAAAESPVSAPVPSTDSANDAAGVVDAQIVPDDDDLPF